MSTFMPYIYISIPRNKFCFSQMLWGMRERKTTRRKEKKSYNILMGCAVQYRFHTEFVLLVFSFIFCFTLYWINGDEDKKTPEAIWYWYHEMFEFKL